jgi:hypothetical protein
MYVDDFLFVFAERCMMMIFYLFLQKRQIVYRYIPVWVHPLINLQVAVGCQNVLSSTLNMTYENVYNKLI